MISNCGEDGVIVEKPLGGFSYSIAYLKGEELCYTNHLVPRCLDTSGLELLHSRNETISDDTWLSYHIPLEGAASFKVWKVELKVRCLPVSQFHEIRTMADFRAALIRNAVVFEQVTDAIGVLSAIGTDAVGVHK